MAQPPAPVPAPGEEDYYELLGVSCDASAREIASAYRSKALRLHPDKNTGHDASELFHRLAKAYQVLTDADTKRAFDTLLALRSSRRAREQSLSAERQAMQEELLDRERAARKRRSDEEAAELRLQQEVERLRREGHARAQERRAQDEHERQRQPLFDDLDRTVKVSASAGVATGGRPRKDTIADTDARASARGLLEESQLRRVLGAFGRVENVLVSKKGLSAVIECSDVLAARAIVVEAEKGGFAGLSVSWAKGHAPPIHSAPENPHLVQSKDFESLTLMRMRQQAERAQLRAKLEAQSAVRSHPDSDPKKTSTNASTEEQ